MKLMQLPALMIRGSTRDEIREGYIIKEYKKHPNQFAVVQVVCPRTKQPIYKECFSNLTKIKSAKTK